MRCAGVRRQDRTPRWARAGRAGIGDGSDGGRSRADTSPGSTGRRAAFVGGPVCAGSERFGGTGGVARRAVHRLRVVGGESGGMRLPAGGAAVVAARRLVLVRGKVSKRSERFVRSRERPGGCCSRSRYSRDGW